MINLHYIVEICALYYNTFSKNSATISLFSELSLILLFTSFERSKERER